MHQTQGGYKQSQYQHGHSQSYSGPPPAKRPKSNPVITRYPPPPGYRGPAQPQPPYVQQGWQAPTPNHSYGQPGYPAYTQHPYAAPPSHQQSPWPASQPQSYPQTGYPPSQGYYAPNPAYAPPSQQWPTVTSAHPSAPPQTWQPPSTIPSKRRHNSTTFPPHASNHSVGPLDGNGDPLPPQQATATTGDDLEEDFDGECYFSRHPEEINPDLSIGLIEWHAPLPTTMPPPATFAEAELEAIAPRKPRPADEESISDYHTKDKRDQTLLSVRQTAAWQEVKDDLIYREFPIVGKDIVPRCHLHRDWRNRPDPDWLSSTPRIDSTPTPHTSRQPTPAQVTSSGESMDIARDSIEHFQREDVDMLGNLERAPSYAAARRSSRQASRHRSHSRTGSVSSQAGEKISRPKPLAPVRDPAQEDILAALGVTGAPKLVYQTPGPAFGAPPPRSREGSAALSRHSSVASSTRQPAPSYRGHEPGSPNDIEATPRPKGGWTESTRKRSHGEFEANDSGIGWEDDEPTPRPKAKQQRFDAQ